MRVWDLCVRVYSTPSAFIIHISRSCCNKNSQNLSSQSGVPKEAPLWDQAELDNIFESRRVHVATRRWTWGCARTRGKVSFFHRGRTQLTDAQKARKNKELTPGQQKLKRCLKVRVYMSIWYILVDVIVQSASHFDFLMSALF